MSELENTYNIIVDVTAKDAERRIHEIGFLQDELKKLVGAIRAEGSESLRRAANEAVKRISDWKRREDQERLASELSAGRTAR